LLRIRLSSVAVNFLGRGLRAEGARFPHFSILFAR
jgi:hypothetical protein